MATPTAFQRVGNPDLYAQSIAHAYISGYRIYDPSTAIQKDPDIEAKMMRFPAIAAPLSVRHHSIAGRRALVVPADESGKAGKALAQIVGKIISKIQRFDQAKINLARADVSGARYAKIEKRAIKAKWGDGVERTWIVPYRLVDIPKENFRYVPDRTTDKPRAKLEYARKNQGRLQWIPVPPFAPLVKHKVNDSEEMLGYGRGLRDVLQHLFLALSRCFVADIQAAERFGHGWLHLKLDHESDGSPTISNTDLVDQSQTALNRMRADWNFITGKNDELVILGPPSSSTDFMGKLTERLERMCDRVIMGGSLFAGGGAGDEGSYARAETEADTGDLIFDACSGFLEDTITTDVIRPIVNDNRENFAALGLGEAEAPEYQIIRGRKQDPGEAANRISVLLQAGIPLLRDEVYDLVQMSKPDDDDEVIEAPQQPQMGGMDGLPFKFAEQWDESKVKRDKGKFATKEGAGSADFSELESTARKVLESSGFDTSGIRVKVKETPGGPNGHYDPRDGVVYLNPSAGIWPAGVASEQHDLGKISSPSQWHTVVHEMAHALHDSSSPRYARVNQDPSVFDSTGWKDAASEVSEQATKSPNEFVAEVVAGLAYGNEYSPEVMRHLRFFAHKLAPKDEPTVDLAAVDASETQPAGIVKRKKNALGRGLKGLIRSTDKAGE